MVAMSEEPQPTASPDTQVSPDAGQEVTLAKTMVSPVPMPQEMNGASRPLPGFGCSDSNSLRPPTR